VTTEPLAESLRRLLARQTRDGRTLGDLIIEVLIRNALAGDIRFIREVFDRAYGKPRQAADVAAPDGPGIDIDTMRDRMLDAVGDDAEARVKVADAFHKVAEMSRPTRVEGRVIILPNNGTAWHGAAG
jgi:hypothetical protein